MWPGVARWKRLNSYLFLAVFFCELSYLVPDWIGVSGADPSEVAAHFHQFTYLVGGSINKRSFMQLLWLLCVWIMCTEHNNRLFSNEVNSMYQLLEKVKINSYWWMKAANAVYVLEIHNWFTFFLCTVKFFLCTVEHFCIFSRLLFARFVLKKRLCVNIYSIFTYSKKKTIYQ